MKADARRNGGKGQFRIVEFINPSGEKVHRVTGWKLDGKRVRENLKTHGEAVARMAELEIESANLKTAARPIVTRLSQDQVAIAETAFGQLGEHSMLDAVRYYLENYREPVTKISVSNAFEKFISARVAANRRPQSIGNLKAKCGELVRLCGKRGVDQISSDTIRELIFKPSRGPVSRSNHRRAFNAFFNWAVQQRFCAVNPVAVIERVKIDRQEPAVLTPEQAESLLRAAQGHKAGILVPYVALGLFAGLRPTELARLTWDKIDLKAKTIVIGADMAKMRARRIVELEDNAVDWLRPFAATRPAIVAPNWQKDFNAVKEAAGWGTPTEDKPGLKPWPQDLMRHSAISYHLAKHQHEGKTAQWAGNSPDIIQRHYKGLVTPTAATRFWAIVPKVPKGKIIKANIKRKVAA